MRTTLVIEDDVLEAARSLAEAEGKSVGEVISTLAQRGLAPRSHETIEGDSRSEEKRSVDAMLLAVPR